LLTRHTHAGEVVGSIPTAPTICINGLALTALDHVHVSLKKSLETDRAGNRSADEYVRGDAHTNTIEGYFSILKRGIVGTYHHVSPQHLKHYLGEFDFRYNERVALGVNDKARAEKAIKGIAGKRLT
jgi:hypothetical protein